MSHSSGGRVSRRLSLSPKRKSRVSKSVADLSCIVSQLNHDARLHKYEHALDFTETPFFIDFKKETAALDLDLTPNLFQVLPIFLKSAVSTPVGAAAGAPGGTAVEEDERTAIDTFASIIRASGGQIDAADIESDLANASIDRGQLVHLMRNMGYRIKRDEAEHMIAAEDTDGDGSSSHPVIVHQCVVRRPFVVVIVRRASPVRRRIPSSCVVRRPFAVAVSLVVSHPDAAAQLFFVP